MSFLLQRKKIIKWCFVFYSVLSLLMKSFNYQANIFKKKKIKIKKIKKTSTRKLANVYPIPLIPYIQFLIGNELAKYITKNKHTKQFQAKKEKIHVKLLNKSMKEEDS
ncbi:LOW QUALITY PROTEIN: hypothetical protein PanWU01x14_081910 [Parasponia andersonii]|uniref:Uncharacterized protein n=1 Tax=Parasponia andersonii TaxID=3476 RepID=A0A2P5DAF5_PARAD|nr:LOW QUALITY PROTEIN: hypothetical protein PanWU01x14_081910 [Parasponia andersonii]